MLSDTFLFATLDYDHFVSHATIGSFSWIDGRVPYNKKGLSMRRHVRTRA